VSASDGFAAAEKTELLQLPRSLSHDAMALTLIKVIG
jgi:hypothetical protein